MIQQQPMPYLKLREMHRAAKNRANEAVGIYARALIVSTGNIFMPDPILDMLTDQIKHIYTKEAN
jgi:hypothetical protein